MTLSLHLHDPEANDIARLFKSAYWIIIMQILIPLAELVVSANAFAQILIERRVYSMRAQAEVEGGWFIRAKPILSGCYIPGDDKLTRQS